MRGFFLEKSWRASGTGTQTFNASSNYTIPYGKYVITVEGRGAPGNPTSPSYINPTSPGYAYYNPPTGGNEILGPGTPGNYESYVPGSFYDWPAGWNVGPPNWNNAYTNYNPYTPGPPTGTYNPVVYGTYAGSYSPTPGNPVAAVPGNAGGSASAFGITMPGAPSDTAATVVAATPINYYAYPDSSAYPVSVSSGGYVTIKIL